MCLYYIDFILMYNLQEDLVAYNHLLHGAVNSWEQIGALGLQGIGSNCMYAMGMLVGAYIIRFVPEVASWLIPGGVSSGAASLRQCRYGRGDDGRLGGSQSHQRDPERGRFNRRTGRKKSETHPLIRLTRLSC